MRIRVRKMEEWEQSEYCWNGSENEAIKRWRMEGELAMSNTTSDAGQ
jgi:hypothetical protein